MENARQIHPDARDIDDLYQNGLDQLSDILLATSYAGSNSARGVLLRTSNACEGVGCCSKGRYICGPTSQPIS